MKKQLKNIGIALGSFMMTLSPFQQAQAQFFGNDCCDTCCDDSRFDFYADFLYWHISEDNLTFAETRQIQTTALPGTTAAESRVNKNTFHDIHFKWKPGFRIGVGYAIPCSCWDFDVNWINFNAHQTGSTGVTLVDTPPTATTTGSAVLLDADTFFGPGVIASTTAPGDLVDDGPFWDRVHARWHLKFNVVDATIGKNFCVCDNAHLRPFIGARYVNIKQHLDVKGHVANFTTTDVIGGAASTFNQTGFSRLNSKYHAGGLIAGLSGDWNVMCDFNLYGSLGAGVVYGNVRANNVDRTTGTVTVAGVTTPVTTTTFINRHHRQLAGIIDLAAGVEWNPHYFECVDVRVLVGYEFHKYFDQNFFRLLDTDGHNIKGNLGLHGLTVRGLISF